MSKNSWSNPELKEKIVEQISKESSQLIDLLISDECVNNSLAVMIKKVLLEINGSINAHNSFNSRHEALGVIWEEFLEVSEEIHKNDDANVENELKQLSSACIIFMFQLYEEIHRKNDN